MRFKPSFADAMLLAAVVSVMAYIVFVVDVAYLGGTIAHNPLKFDATLAHSVTQNATDPNQGVAKTNVTNGENSPVVTGSNNVVTYSSESVDLGEPVSFWSGRTIRNIYHERFEYVDGVLRIKDPKLTVVNDFPKGGAK